MRPTLRCSSHISRCNWQKHCNRCSILLIICRVTLLTVSLFISRWLFLRLFSKIFYFEPPEISRKPQCNNSEIKQFKNMSSSLEGGGYLVTCGICSFPMYCYSTVWFRANLCCNPKVIRIVISFSDYIYVYYMSSLSVDQRL